MPKDSTPDYFKCLKCRVFTTGKKECKNCGEPRKGTEKKL